MYIRINRQVSGSLRGPVLGHEYVDIYDTAPTSTLLSVLVLRAPAARLLWDQKTKSFVWRQEVAQLRVRVCQDEIVQERKMSHRGPRL